MKPVGIVIVHGYMHCLACHRARNWVEPVPVQWVPSETFQNVWWLSSGGQVTRCAGGLMYAFAVEGQGRFFYTLAAAARWLIKEVTP
jgi:hypothetical protein